jgi:hypothetical protein
MSDRMLQMTRVTREQETGNRGYGRAGSTVWLGQGVHRLVVEQQGMKYYHKPLSLFKPRREQF